MIKEEALDGSVDDLMENTTVLFNHDPNRAIGKVLAAKKKQVEGTLGLWVKVLISKSESKIWKQIQEGILNKFSIRGKVEKARKEFVESLGRIANVIYKMKLIENSIVSLPANPKARALVAYVSKALSEFEKEGGSIAMDEFLKELLTAAISLEDYQKEFGDFCTAKKVDVEKATDEELGMVFGEFVKQSDHAVAVTEAIAAAEMLLEKLPDDLKEAGQKLMDALNKVRGTLTARYPYPKPKANDEEKDKEEEKGKKEKDDDEEEKGAGDSDKDKEKDEEKEKKEKQDDEEEEEEEEKKKEDEEPATLIRRLISLLSRDKAKADKAEDEKEEEEKGKKEKDEEDDEEKAKGLEVKVRELLDSYFKSKDEDAEKTVKISSDAFLKTFGDDLSKKIEEIGSKVTKDIQTLASQVDAIDKALPGERQSLDPDNGTGEKGIFSGLLGVIKAE